MTVFKGYLKVIKKTLPIILMYFGIFLGIYLMIALTESASPVTDFSATRLSVAVIDRDGGEAAKGLTEYIGLQHDLVDLPDDKNTLQKELFYRNVDYIVYIPENFEQVCLVDKEPLEIVKVPDSYTGFYVDQCIDQYMNQIGVYQSAGYTLTESIDKTLATLDTEADVQILDAESASIPEYYYLFRFLPYLMIAIMCYGVSTVMVTFRQRDMRMRMSCAPISTTSQNIQAVLAFLLLGICYLIICLGFAFIFNGKELLNTSHLIYYIINAALCMGLSLALAFFIGMIAKNASVITSITNVLSLGLCFLGGVFVPLDFLSESITKVSQLLPVYWYEEILLILVQFPELSAANQASINRGLLIQLLYIAALFCIGLVIGRVKSQDTANV